MFRPDSKLMHILETASEFIALNLLFVISCLPVVTIGAASAAMYTVTRRMARKESPAIMQAFFEAFHANWRQSLTMNLILLTPLILLLGIRGLVAWQILVIPPVFQPLLTLAIGIFSLVWTYVWPIQAWFDNSAAATLRNAMLLPFGSPVIAAAATGLNLIPLWLLSRYPGEFLQISFFWFAAAFSLTAYVNTQLLRFQMRQYLLDMK